MTADPNPNPNLKRYNSTQALQEMSAEIQKSRKYFEAVCHGVGELVEGDLAYTYYFTLTRDTEPNAWDKFWGSCPMEFVHGITNDEYHSIWVPREGDVMPADWASGVRGDYRSKPIKNVRRVLSAQAEHVKRQLESARSNADGICNLQGSDFADIAQIASALASQNGLLDALIERLGSADDDAQRLHENIQDHWSGDSADVYAGRINDFKLALMQFSTASVDMKSANITVATHVGELLVAVLELWKARMEAMIDGIGKAVGAGEDIAGFLAKPKVMTVLTTILDIVLDVVKKMATDDVKQRIESLNVLGQIATKLAPIERAKASAGQVPWPQLTSWSPTPR